MILYDTHAHVNDACYEADLAEVLLRAREAGVSRMNVIGYDLASSERAVAIAHAYENVYAVIGVHPHDADTWTSEVEARFRELLAANQGEIVAIGEIGLDYHFDDSLPKDVQKRAFQEQMRLAYAYELPFVVHDREAHQDCLEAILAIGQEGLLREEPGVFHCYSGSLEFSKRLLDLGFYLGFDGPVTFKNGKKPLAVASSVPEDRLLLETDCPYLSPEPFRGKRNEPSYLCYVNEKIAEARGVSPEALAARTTQNARHLFRV